MLKKDIDIAVLQKLIDKLPEDFIIDRIEFSKPVTVYFHIDANFFLREKPEHTLEELIELIRALDN